MYPRLIEVQNATEAAAVEQTLAMLRELNRMADDAADGHVIARVEELELCRQRYAEREEASSASRAASTCEMIDAMCSSSVKGDNT